MFLEILKLTLFISISMHMSLSKVDMRNSKSGLVAIFVLIMSISTIVITFNLNTEKIINLIIVYNIYVFLFLTLGLIFGLVGLFVSFILYKINKIFFYM